MIRSVSYGGRTLKYTLISTSRRNVLIKALPGGETRVYAPSGARLRDVDAIVASRIDEILRMQTNIDEAVRQNRLAHPLRPGSRVCIEGKPYALRLQTGRRTEMRLDGDECILTLNDIEDEERVRAALKAALSKMALTRVRQRLEEYAPGLGVCFGRVTIRDQKSRWGSCSQKRNLNFNWKLIMAPEAALTYVVIHELCHLIEFNHSPRFWRLVEGQMPEYEYWKKWLKTHGSELGVG